jgi:Holliday junction resolvase RusA-like endonuclease
MGRWGAYYPKTYANWRTSAKALLRCPEYEVQIYHGPLFAAVFSVCKRPKKITVPLPRGDVDNFSKAVLDAITQTEIVWHDDQQVECLISGKRYANEGEAPHTFVRISHDASDIFVDELYGLHKIGD